MIDKALGSFLKLISGKIDNISVVHRNNLQVKIWVYLVYLVPFFPMEILTR